ncbi:MAG: hypothetical protein ACOX6V_05110 [Patescibacteria group bacterium]|jgi:hypothetical protein
MLAITLIKDKVREIDTKLDAQKIALENLKENILYTNKTLRELKALLGKKK